MRVKVIVKVKLMVRVFNLLKRKITLLITITITIKTMPIQPIKYLMFNVIRI